MFGIKFTLKDTEEETKKDFDLFNIKETIKTCPFCGEKPYIDSNLFTNFPSGSYLPLHNYFEIKCKNCSIYFSKNFDEENLFKEIAVDYVVNKWNTRKGDAE